MWKSLGCRKSGSPSFGGRRPRNPQPSSRTRTRRSGSRLKRRSSGAGEAFAVRRKRNRAYFATTQGQRGTSSLPVQTNQGILRSLTLPLNDSGWGVCAAGYKSLGYGGMSSPWTRRPTISVIQRPQAAESHAQEQRSTSSLPVQTNQGILRSLTLPLNDSGWGVCAAGYKSLGYGGM